jgi:EAL domain-containing protein (putative c-di-GMP-specific phosphodiesterase class I)
MTIIAWAGPAARLSAPASDRLELHSRSVAMTYQPILDVARGVAAGYQAQVATDRPREVDLHTPWSLVEDPSGIRTAAAIESALAAFPTLPGNTFLSIPVGTEAVTTPAVRSALLSPKTLAGIVLDVVGPTGGDGARDLAAALDLYRAEGALIALGGNGAPQPELASIVRLKPAMIRLGREWIRDIDTSRSKRSAIEVIGALAGQLDAWIVAEGVSNPAELRVLAGLGVPLAQGGLIGEPKAVWPSIELSARTALPVRPMAPTTDAVLRSLVQPAYTASDAAAAAAILPETTGFDVVVVVDDLNRPTGLLEQNEENGWTAGDVLAVNVETPVRDAVQRAMARPRSTRFSPLVCTDVEGRVLGVLRIERLMGHLSSG